MRRALVFMWSILLCLSVFSGCIANQPTRNVVELTEENLWKYIAVSEITSFVKAESDESLECVVSGVLDYALYEDVVLVFEISYYAPGAVGEAIKSKPVSIALNSAGDAAFEVVSTGLAVIQDGKGSAARSEPVGELYWFNRTIRLESVTGKVIYTI